MADLLLDGRVAIVTGASGGIGAAIVARYTKAGARVAALDIEGRVPAAPEGGMAMACDVADDEAVARAVAAVFDAYGRIDILVNNAAGPVLVGKVTEITAATWRETLEINLTGAFLMCQQVIPHMAAGGGGVIVNVASQLGTVTTKGRAPYSASKAGLISLTRTLAVDHAEDGIRAVSLSPGAVMTSRLTSVMGGEDGVQERLGKLHALGRVGRPEEIAEAALFIASDGASFMTGTDMLVDGGYTAT
ncbi:short-chain dehydrogenase [Acuticoccus sediminis]|uniref:Short-chain dehydrogenase n=1 Tax=Acuticoccus sediminis TaxID=2184697 RepID=A0A8B2NYK6_9HYPH|nr:SDR family oxidoreductase [Acuticoccus sediminis]RAI02976.1 short-chain dehydrogenase [Acuticoccus sediminis]